MDKESQLDQLFPIQSMGPEDREHIETNLSNVVYAAVVSIFESLEHLQQIDGNGHHAAQKVAAAAVEELKSRWCSKS